MKRFLALLLLAAVLVGCTNVSASADLMDGITPGAVDAADVTAADAAAIAALALTLLRDEAVPANALISPLSIVAALGMTANGAAGETRSQMEAALGLPVEQINALMAGLSAGDDTLRLANGIWFRDADLTVRADFLQTNADYYGAAARQTAMDADTVREINAFVEENTGGMIKNMLDRNDLSEDTVMCLVNALAFEAEWASVYHKSDVRQGEFTLADGSKTKVDFMYGTESTYLADENATGFIKYYKGRDYAFAALLPNEGVTLDEYIAALDGEKLVNLLAGAESTLVYTALPKFSYTCAVELAEPLARAGMTDAFDAGTADFSQLGESTRGNIYIDRVVHKTYISVAEQGTRAGAATAVMMQDRAAARIMEEPKRVYLDRPFLYLILDTASNLPVFIGTLTDPS